MGFVVAGEATVVHEPAEGPLDDPAPRDHLEALLGRVAAGDFDVDVEGITTSILPQQVLMSFVPQKSSSPDAPDGFFAQESWKILNQPEDPSAVEESETLDMYTITGP